jgi:bile acid:Na+ symporter, BASS family
MIRSSHAAEAAHFDHKHFIWTIVASYVAAAFPPQFGLWIRTINLSDLLSLQYRVNLTLSPVLLAALLFNAGLGVPLHELSALCRTPDKVFVMIAPLIGTSPHRWRMIAAIRLAMMFWHDAEEVQQLLVGLALVAAMPIAGASTAWAQDSYGNIVLSPGLVLLTTLLSPLTTPLTAKARSRPYSLIRYDPGPDRVQRACLRTETP